MVEWINSLMDGKVIGVVFFPTCQMRVVSFYVRCAAPPSSCPSSFFPLSSPDLICRLLIGVGLAGLHLPALDRSDRRRTSSASAWSQWSSPDLFCQHLMAVGLAGPQLLARDRWASPDFNRRESERCGPRRTSTCESLSAVGLAGLQPASLECAVGLAGLQPARVWALGLAGLQTARVWALWASPDFNRRDSARSGPRRTSAGPQRPETKPYRYARRYDRQNARRYAR